MRLVLGGVNGEYLRDIIEVAADSTAEVLAAVAYATDSTLLFDWCIEKKIPIKFYGRLDETVPVPAIILRRFLDRRSPNFVCSLVELHHAKVIWWRGHGVYVGSANLTTTAWYKGIEAGCFFLEEELDDDTAEGLLALFERLEINATPLTEELYRVMLAREQALTRAEVDDSAFWKSPSFKRWPGLAQTARLKAQDQRRQKFLAEWHSTLQDLRNIGAAVSEARNRPSWIRGDAPVGAQADQFLHAHYYQRTFDGRRANYKAHYEENRHNREVALADAMRWWSQLRAAPSTEDQMISTTAPFLQGALSQSSLSNMNSDTFRDICLGVHAILDYGRRVPNVSVDLPDDGSHYTIPEKVRALSARIWSSRSAEGKHVTDMLAFVLYGGPDAALPDRLWKAVTDTKWKIRGLGISALGEMVGWALPDKFPPRNGRTSKALRSLGYDVTIHVE